MVKLHSHSEVHAYSHILNELTSKKGWDKKQIFTQQECLSIKLISEHLGQTHPENIVKVSESIYYVIEAKNERIKIDTALKEAREDYADLINKSKQIKSLFITGIAGNNEEGFIASSQFLKDGKWETITENGVEVTGLLSNGQIERILSENTPHLKDIEIDEKEFLKTAEEINDILHEGGVHKDIRARVISAILLALIEGTNINLDEAPTVLIDSINSRVDLELKKAKKPEFSKFIHIDTPSSEDNHNKLKKAIVLTIQELLQLNIRSAMKSGKDVLGRFYEVFLKYGNGAKEIGIVLTPRHITQFSAEVIDIQPNDLVLDPTCGTGGFLVAAFDEVKRKTSGIGDEWDKFQKWGLYGIEEQDFIVSLALVNMIFRGDGKNNVIGGDCFAKWLTAKTRNGNVIAEYLSLDSNNRIPPITKVLMNPPFPKKKTDRKPYLFIEQALKQMQDGGILFSVLPYSSMIRSGSYLAWRKRLLKNNTLLSVVTFPEDLFYPVGVHTVGIFVKKGIPHNNANILWFRALNDGRLKKKGKRLKNPRAKNDYLIITPILKQFIVGNLNEIVSIPAFQKLCQVDLQDNNLELVPEAYLDEPNITPSEVTDAIEQLIRESIAFRIQFERELEKIDK
ncbi:N-6 DNA methylase [Candidatus Bathyarchaeota archaeon]|nr:N-6 DNA methylase [Candidatus Bathyarchaeota archaeon]